MKRLLIAPLILGLLSPFSAIAEEKTFKCLELGKEACLDKLIAIGTCGYITLKNDEPLEGETLVKSYKFYKALVDGLRIKTQTIIFFQ